MSLQGHAVAGYAPLITAYIKVLMSRITFTIKVSIKWMVREQVAQYILSLLQNPEIPGTLSFEDKPFQVPSDIDYV